MKNTSKSFYNALERTYQDIKYNHPDNTGYPFDMIHDVAYLEQFNPEYYVVFIKSDYFSSYSLRVMDKDDISGFNHFDRELTSFKYMIVKYHDQILTYDINKNTIEYISNILSVLYNISYENMKYDNPDKLLDYPYNKEMFKRDYKKQYKEWS